jgi:hypothetical protein
VSVKRDKRFSGFSTSKMREFFPGLVLRILEVLNPEKRSAFWKY